MAGTTVLSALTERFERTSLWRADETLCCVGPRGSVPSPVSRCEGSTAGSVAPSSQASGSGGRAIGYAPAQDNGTSTIVASLCHRQNATRRFLVNHVYNFTRVSSKMWRRKKL